MNIFGNDRYRPHLWCLSFMSVILCSLCDQAVAEAEARWAHTTLDQSPSRVVSAVKSVEEGQDGMTFLYKLYIEVLK